MKPRTIVCIDDDPFYKGLYKDILEPAGYRVISAMDAAEGHKAVINEKPDLITLDVMMPEKAGFNDGFGLLKLLREDAATKTTPIIMISALNDETDVKQATKDGATDYLPKQDMTPKRLLTKIAKMLK
ncbi:response regulator [Candidatus Uhrbacteria bacterium]|nr:response regulator [Candidatus Uhrbacteria bacterium]